MHSVMFFTTYWCTTFPEFLAISCTNLQENPKKEGHDIYPGNDDIEDAPTGYFVIKDDLIDMSMIYQQEILS